MDCTSAYIYISLQLTCIAGNRALTIAAVPFKVCIDHFHFQFPVGVWHRLQYPLAMFPDCIILRIHLERTIGQEQIVLEVLLNSFR